MTKRNTTSLFKFCNICERTYLRHTSLKLGSVLINKLDREPPHIFISAEGRQSQLSNGMGLVVCNKGVLVPENAFVLRYYLPFHSFVITFIPGQERPAVP
jgi:hypothetical protein